MIWLLVLVVRGSIAVFGPGWFEALEEITLADLLEQVTGQKYLESGVSVQTAKHRPANSHSLRVRLHHLGVVSSSHSQPLKSHSFPANLKQTQA